MRSNAREPKVRVPAHGRCPRCKKVRKLWVRANECNDRRVFSRNVAGEGKVCWVCVIRETDPKWRPGKPLPKNLSQEDLPIQAEVEQSLAKLKAAIPTGDCELTHTTEDSLYWRVMKAISSGEVKTIEEARALAARCLTTKTMNFERYYA